MRSDKNVTIMIQLAIHEGREGDLRDIADDMCVATAKEEGVLNYEWSVSEDGDPRGLRCHAALGRVASLAMAGAIASSMTQTATTFTTRWRMVRENGRGGGIPATTAVRTSAQPAAPWRFAAFGRSFPPDGAKTDSAWRRTCVTS